MTLTAGKVIGSILLTPVILVLFAVVVARMALVVSISLVFTMLMTIAVLYGEYFLLRQLS